MVMHLEENVEKATEDFGGLREIVATHRTPLYVYSKRKLRARISQLRSAFDVPRFSLLFATMANDEPEILPTIAQEGVGACVNSPLHLELALCAGFNPSNVQFTSTGIPLRDMLQIKARGIAVNLDSPSQIALWCQEANGGKVGARINAASMLNLDFGQEWTMRTQIVNLIYCRSERKSAD